MPHRCRRFLLSVLTLAVLCSTAFQAVLAAPLPKLKPGDKVIVDWGGEQVGEFIEYTPTGWLRVRIKGTAGLEQTPALPPNRFRLPPKGAAAKNQEAKDSTPEKKA